MTVPTPLPWQEIVAHRCLFENIGGDDLRTTLWNGSAEDCFCSMCIMMTYEVGIRAEVIQAFSERLGRGVDVFTNVDMQQMAFFVGVTEAMHSYDKARVLSYLDSAIPSQFLLLKELEIRLMDSLVFRARCVQEVFEELLLLIDDYNDPRRVMICEFACFNGRVCSTVSAYNACLDNHQRARGRRVAAGASMQLPYPDGVGCGVAPGAAPCATFELTTGPCATSELTTGPCATSELTTAPCATSELTTAPCATSETTTALDALFDEDIFEELGLRLLERSPGEEAASRDGDVIAFRGFEMDAVSSLGGACCICGSGARAAFIACETCCSRILFVRVYSEIENGGLKVRAAGYAALTRDQANSRGVAVDYFNVEGLSVKHDIFESNKTIVIDRDNKWRYLERYLERAGKAASQEDWDGLRTPPSRLSEVSSEAFGLAFAAA